MTQAEKPKNEVQFELILRLTPQFAMAIQRNPLHEDLHFFQFIEYKHGLALQRIHARRADNVIKLGPSYKIVSGGKTVFADTSAMRAIKADLQDMAEKFPYLIQHFECVEYSDKKPVQQAPHPLPLTA